MNSLATLTSRHPSMAAKMSFQQKPVVSIISLKKEKMNTHIAPPSGKSSILQGETWCSARIIAIVISAQASPPMPRCAHLSIPQSEKRPLKKSSIFFIIQNFPNYPTFISLPPIRRLPAAIHWHQPLIPNAFHHRSLCLPCCRHPLLQ